MANEATSREVPKNMCAASGCFRWATMIVEQTVGYGVNEGLQYQSFYCKPCAKRKLKELNGEL